MLRRLILKVTKFQLPPLMRKSTVVKNIWGYHAPPPSMSNRVKRLKTEIHTAVRRNLEEILEVKTFCKMYIGFKCRGPKVELPFCSFTGCVHFSTAGTDKEK